MLKYKIDVIDCLKDAGYSTARIRKEKLLSQSTLQFLREGKPVGAIGLDDICKLLGKQPGDIFEYVDNDIEE